MQHAVTRVLGIAAVVAALVGGVVGAAPAQAADKDLGWVRLQPASGKTDIAVLALTSGACPDGQAITMGLKGPNIPSDNTVGNLVGVTEYKAFDPTMTGQLWVPLSTTFRGWFAVNGITVKPGAAYTVSVVCRDLLSASKSYGSFSGQVVFDAKGGYKAVGEAAKPFNTELKPDDPLAVPTQSASGSGKPGGGKPSGSPSTKPSGDPSGSADPSTDPGEAIPDSSAPGEVGGTTVAAPVSPTSSSGIGALPFVLLALVAAAGATWVFLRRRTEPAAAPTGRRERPPTDEL